LSTKEEIGLDKHFYQLENYAKNVLIANYELKHDE